MSDSGSGFDQYMSSSGNTSSSSNSSAIQTLYGQPTAAPTQGFPSSYNYPSLTKKQLTLTVPSSDTLHVTKQTPAGYLHDDHGRLDLGASPTLTIQQMLDALLKQSLANPQAIADLQDSLIMSGYLDPRKKNYVPGGQVQPGDATWDAYAHALLDSVRTNTGWQELINKKINQGVGEQKFNLSSTSERIDITNPQDAQQHLTSVMTDLLGRRPMNREVQQFSSHLASMEQANPVEETTHVDLSQALNSAQGRPQKATTTVTSGGVNPDAAAEGFVMNNKGGEVAQAQADSLYRVFLSMLDGEV